MISLADIDSLVRSGESETLEFKRTTGERREAARTICAMLTPWRASDFRRGARRDSNSLQINSNSTPKVPNRRFLSVLFLDNQQVTWNGPFGLIGAYSPTTTGPVVATERQVREDLAILKVLGLANSNGHGRGARWKLL